MKDKLKWDYSFQNTPSSEEIYKSLAFHPHCEITTRAKELILSKCINANYTIDIRGEDFVELSKDAQVIDGDIIKSTICSLKAQTWILYYSLLGCSTKANVQSMILCIFVPPDGSASSSDVINHMVDPKLSENLIFGIARDSKLSNEVEVVMFISFAKEE